MHAVFIDFEKAFDKINHIYLIKKLNNLKIPKELLNILHSFLKNRKGFINFQNFSSSIFIICQYQQSKIFEHTYRAF